MTVCGYMADLYGLLPGWGRMPPFLLYTGFGWRAMRLGLIQMEVVSGDKERNITHAFELMGRVSHQADMIVLPELWTIGYDFHNLGKNATYMGDGLIQRLSSLAVHTGTYIIAGTLPVKKGGVIRNTGLVFGKDGDIKGEYSKRHLFYGYLEAELMRPGRKLLYEDIDGVRTGMAVCYEFYFPRMWRKMAKRGVMLVAAPASWPAMHIYQWDVLTRARAIENGLCIAAVNMSGNYRGMKMGGHSRFIDPLGKVQAEAGEEESVLYADYDEKAYKDFGKQLAVIRLDKQRCFHA